MTHAVIRKKWGKKQIENNSKKKIEKEVENNLKKKLKKKRKKWEKRLKNKLRLFFKGINFETKNKKKQKRGILVLKFKFCS